MLPHLEEKYTGYVNITYHEIYNHRIKEYRELGDDKMQKNDALMKREITGETHFEDLLQKIEDCVKNVASHKPHTPAQTVSIGFKIIDKYGFYNDDFRDWRRKSKLEKTWPIFKVHFARAFKETRDSKKTARNSGYANLVSQMWTDM